MRGLWSKNAIVHTTYNTVHHSIVPCFNFIVGKVRSETWMWGWMCTIIDVYTLLYHLCIKKLQKFLFLMSYFTLHKDYFKCIKNVIKKLRLRKKLEKGQWVWLPRAEEFLNSTQIHEIYICKFTQNSPQLKSL